MGVPGLELGTGHATFRPAGPTNVESFLALLREVLKACQEAEVTRLLVDLTQLRHRPLSIVDRFWGASGLAEFWDRKVKLAIVGRAKHLDPEHFGEMVALNRGLHVGVYTSEPDALEWLLAAPAGGPEKIE